ncbi:hypothetical protein AtEden1_Chr4g0277741 [Arabidopsis thaliana]
MKIMRLSQNSQSQSMFTLNFLYFVSFVSFSLFEGCWNWERRKIESLFGRALQFDGVEEKNVKKRA